MQPFKPNVSTGDRFAGTRKFIRNWLGLPNDSKPKAKGGNHKKELRRQRAFALQIAAINRRNRRREWSF
jgi:hypothetical protein